MDYEKKYKEALEKARQLCAYPTTKPFISDLQDLFPELAESEDERIRKELIKVFSNREKYLIDQSFGDITVSEILTWLEKQAEQKPAWSEKDKKEYKYVLKFVDNILNNCGNKKDYEHCKRCDDWLKSLKERIGG